jgi:hypothetical protein
MLSVSPNSKRDWQPDFWRVNPEVVLDLSLIGVSYPDGRIFLAVDTIQVTGS